MRPVPVLALVLAVGVCAEAGTSWETDFERAKLRAIQEDKPIFLDFYADG